VLEGHYIEGFKVQEIAARHGWSETAVRIRLLRARRSVVRRLRKNKTDKLRTMEVQKRSQRQPVDMDLFEQVA
jgi:hypothetical protein